MHIFTLYLQLSHNNLAEIECLYVKNGQCSNFMRKLYLQLAHNNPAEIDCLHSKNGHYILFTIVTHIKLQFTGRKAGNYIIYTVVK
jgi:hypothetical protein